MASISAWSASTLTSGASSQKTRTTSSPFSAAWARSDASCSAAVLTTPSGS